MARSEILAAVALTFVLALPRTGTAADTAAPADPSRARVEGAVMDEAGRPVAGAVVRLVSSGGEGEGGTARTGPDGRFRIVLDGPMAAGQQVLAGSGDGTRQALAQTEYEDYRAAVQVHLVLKPCRELTVHVLDERKKPVSGALVAVVLSSLHPLPPATDTDAKGVARLRLPADAKVEAVIGLKAGVGFDYYENRRPGPNRDRRPLPAEVTLVLDGTQAMCVRTVDTGGQAVRGITVLPWTLMKQGKFDEINLSGCARLSRFAARTDARGEATFDWFPAHVRGVVAFLVSSQEYYQPNFPYFDPAHPETQRLTTQLQRLVPASGRVTFPGGRPAGGILLQAEGEGKTNHYYRGFARTAADGSYSLKLYPDQTYIVAVVEQEWAAPSLVGIEVREGQPVKGLDLRLGKGTLLEGRATVGRDRKPMGKQTITVIEQAPGTKAHLVRWAETDADGRYHIRLGRGTYQLMGPDRERQELVIHEEARTERDFALPRPLTSPLRGRVVARAGGRPVAGATVRAETTAPNGRGDFRAVTDDQGSFAVERSPGRGWVYASSPDGRLAGFAALTEDDTEVEVSLRPAATLVGRLVGKDGKPLPGVHLDCRMEVGPKEARAGSARLGAQADPEGRFVLGGIVPGSRCLLTAFTVYTGMNELKEIVVKGSKKVDLGDVVIDLKP